MRSLSKQSAIKSGRVEKDRIFHRTTTPGRGLSLSDAKFYSRSHDVMIRVFDEAGDAGTRILPRNVDATGAVPEWGEALALVQV